jgi:hypothetical protein
MFLQFSKTIFKILLAIFISFFVIELYFQIVERTNLWRVFPTINPILGQPDYQMGYKFTPNVNKIWIKENKNRVKINNYGLHDYPIAKSDNRILITGNSMIEALQVELEHNFENLTEIKLKKNIKDLQINNLSMSGHGPLRQLIMLENFGYQLNPNLIIMFIPLSEFLLPDLTDDNLNPGYKINGDDVVRSYTFRDRKQIKFSNYIFFDKLLFLIREISTLRMLYFLSKKDLFSILKINNNEHNYQNKAQFNCPTKYVIDQKKLWIDKFPSEKSTVSDFFFKDLNNSLNRAKLEALIVITGLSYFTECKKDIEISNNVFRQIHDKFASKNIEFINFESLLLKNLKKKSPTNYINHRSNMYGFSRNIGDGHLNYYGHEIYSEIFTEIIKNNYLKKNLYEK